MRRIASKLAGFLIAPIMACALVFAGGTPNRHTPQNHAAWTLESILRQMDAASKNFHSLAADIERTKVTVVVNDRSTETGTTRVRGDKMLLQINAPEARTVLRTGDNLYLYTPGLKRVEEFNLGKNRGMVEQFLLLGFGTPGHELQKSYDIKLAGESTIDDRKTVELELTPRSDAVRKHISKFEIWLDLSSCLPLQQEFVETGSGDFSIMKYTHVEKNPNIPDSEFKPHWPKGTEKVKPQM
jgi:outer membrane lipoprotein-sorting protein